MQKQQAWNELCKITDTLFPKYRSRVVAFQEACRQRPDLAGAAIDPLGAPVVARKGSKKTGNAKETPLEKLHRMARERAKAEGGSFYKAYELVLATPEGKRLYEAYLKG